MSKVRFISGLAVAAVVVGAMAIAGTASAQGAPTTPVAPAVKAHKMARHHHHRARRHAQTNLVAKHAGHKAAAAKQK